MIEIKNDAWYELSGKWSLRLSFSTNDPVFSITPWYEGSSSTGYGLGTSWPAPFFQESLMLTNFWVNEPGLFTFFASGQPTWNSRHIIYRFKLGIHIFISMNYHQKDHNTTTALHFIVIGIVYTLTNSTSIIFWICTISKL